MSTLNTVKDERKVIKILHDSFGWALTKDRALFESIFAKEDDFFTYYPDSKNTVMGWSQFEKYLDSWMADNIRKFIGISPYRKGYVNHILRKNMIKKLNSYTCIQSTQSKQMKSV